jgi:hypothetical protein
LEARGSRYTYTIYIYIYIYNGSPGLPLLKRAPARVGPRAQGDVTGGGSTVRVHRVVVGSYVGSSAFMHTEFNENRCVNGNSGGAARVRRDRGGSGVGRTFMHAYFTDIGCVN